MDSTDPVDITPDAAEIFPPAQAPAWTSPEVLALVVQGIPFVPSGIPSDLLAHVGATLADRDSDVVLWRTVAHQALALAHRLHLDNLRLREQALASRRAPLQVAA